MNVEIHLLVLKNCSDSVFLIGFLTRGVFSRLTNRIRINNVVQPQHNKSRQIRRPIRNEDNGNSCIGIESSLFFKTSRKGIFGINCYII